MVRSFTLDPIFFFSRFHRGAAVVYAPFVFSVRKNKWATTTYHTQIPGWGPARCRFGRRSKGSCEVGVTTFFFFLRAHCGRPRFELGSYGGCTCQPSSCTPIRDFFWSAGGMCGRRRVLKSMRGACLAFGANDVVAVGVGRSCLASLRLVTRVFWSYACVLAPGKRRDAH